MKLFDLLKADHQEVKGIFEILSGQQEKSWETVRGLCEKLKLHMALEEQYFYPALEEYQETEELARKSYVQHNEAKELIKLILGENLEDIELNVKLEMLRLVNIHHIQDEENDVFVRAKRVLSDEEIERIGNAIETKKKEVLNLL